MTAPISGGWQGRPYDKRCMWVILPNPNTHPMMQHSKHTGPALNAFQLLAPLGATIALTGGCYDYAPSEENEVRLVTCPGSRG